VLGSSVPGATSNESQRRLHSRICHGLAGDRTVTLQCPSTALLPNLGKECGRRERESRREGRREQSLREKIPSRGVAVKGIPVFWKAALFAGSRWNEVLGRSVVQVAASSAARRRADDSGCPKGAKEGNAVSMRHKAHAPNAGTRHRRMRQGTRPSLGPEARAC
jgi:hypothetical protein